MTLRRLFRLAPAPRRRLVLAVVLGALTILFGAGLMATAGYLISRAAERPAILSLTVAIVAVRFFGLGRPVLRYCDRLVSHDVALRALGRSRVHAYERLEPLAPAQLECYRRGDLLSRVVSDVDALQNLYVRGAGPSAIALLAGTVCVAVATAVLPESGAVLAAGLLLAAVLVPGATVLASRWSSRQQARLRGELSAELVELVAGAPELVVYGADEDRLRQVGEAEARLAQAGRRAAFADGIGDAVRWSVTGLTVGAVLAVAVTAHADGRLDRVLIAMLTLLALASFECIQPLGAAARELVETVAAGGRVLDVIDREPSIVDPAAPRSVPAAAGKIVFEGVRVRYAAEERLALDGFSMLLEPGRRVALVGPSGAGKTTVANLLLRFVDPEAGRVTLGGASLSTYRLDDIRTLIAVAGQDGHLFSATIRDNITLGRTATDAELERVVHDARLANWVTSLPDGLDTLVGEQGTQISGGQRQRIVIARALLGDPRVLVLDEPTAHLDAATAESLVRDVFAAAGERTVLLITHRTEGLELVDEVVELHPDRAMQSTGP
jgi:ATP-binding cassette, subfamily C, bacterial CydC